MTKENTVKIMVSRSDPEKTDKSILQTYEVPFIEGMAILQALDFIYENLDQSLSYYDHGICSQGICKRCLALVNGKPELICQYKINGDSLVEPLPNFMLVKDLVVDRGRPKK